MAEADFSTTKAQYEPVRFELRGQRQATTQVPDALLQSNSTDAMAWLVVARSRRAHGDVKGALEAAKKANAYAKTDEEVFAAALQLAAVNVLLQRGFSAQFWLRRAAQFAPSKELRGQTIKNLRAIRARTPWQFTFRSSVTPSSNINNGSSAEKLELFGLPFILSTDARALSGVEATLSSTARYRFSGLANHPAVLSFGAAIKRATLSREAKKHAPQASGSDYAFDAFEVGFSQVVSNWGEASNLRLDTVIGHNRYGNEALTNYARAGFLAQWPVGAQSLMSFTGSIERQHRFDDNTRSAWVTHGSLSQIWQVGRQGDLVGVTFGLRDTSSNSIEVDHRASLLSFNYLAAEPVIGSVTLAAEIAAERRHYDGSPYSVNGRQDMRGSLSVTLGVPDWNYYGFAPALTFEASRTKSNVSLYNSRNTGVHIGIDSVF